MFQQRNFNYTINKPPVNERLQSAIQLQQQGKLVAARDLYLGILQDQPKNADALRFLGVIEEQAGRYEKAAALLEESASSNPNNPSTFLNLGNVRLHQRRFDVALQHYDRALSIKPDYAHAHLGRGATLERLGQFDQAEGAYELALLANKDFEAAKWNLACLLLLTGRLDEGWGLYESRWKVRSHQLQHRIFGKPLWLGEPDIAGKTLFVYDEQGLGDAIQFARYTKVLASMGIGVVIEAAPALVRLFETLEGVGQLVRRGDTLPEFDFYCPLSSLPLALHTTLQTIPQYSSYLNSPEPDQAFWAERFKENQSLRVGLVWSGNADHSNDRDRSIPLEALLTGLPAGPRYVSLQKEIRPSDRAALSNRPDIVDFTHELGDFASTAGLCSQLDLVISVDTSVAHLAGAIGKETLLLLPKLPDWRWLLERADSPWYPSFRLLRQVTAGDWSPVMQAMRSALESRLRQHAAQSDTGSQG